MSDVVLMTEKISKKYCRTIKHTMLYGAFDLTRSFLGLNQHTESLRNGEFWAVDNVSFELKRGECLGVIGPNGSGKSTLLKMLTGIFMPDKGKIKINGRVGALIEVGAGFHPMLTGRENIYINGSILGLSKKEIDRKFNDIVEFAEIGEFIDSPVKHYSSGMYVRLGFAIAAQMEPDVMLIDEVLAVGDLSFVQKCTNFISDTLKETSTIIVSHNLSYIKRLCKNVILINKGQKQYEGTPEETITRYVNMLIDRSKIETRINKGEGLEYVYVTERKAYTRDSIKKIDNKLHIPFGTEFIIELTFNIGGYIENPEVRISFNLPSNNVLVCSSSTKNRETIPQKVTGELRVKFHFSKPSLYPGEYYINAAICNERVGQYYYSETDVLRIFIDYPKEKTYPDLEPGIGIIYMPCEISCSASETP